MMAKRSEKRLTICSKAIAPVSGADHLRLTTLGIRASRSTIALEMPRLVQNVL